MYNLGKVEKKIYSLREEAPLLIPQIDPDKYGIEEVEKLLRKLSLMGIQHLAIGGSLVDPIKMQNIIDMVVGDFDFSFTTYITNPATALLKGKEGRASVYWATVFNSENPFYLRDSLVMSSLFLKKNNFEPIPTAYVFDNRDSRGTANWLSRSNDIPYNKPEISLANGLACQYLGIRFYILAGGSGSLLPPPVSHVKLLHEKSDLFVIPTSGIKSEAHVKSLLAAGADAMHLGNMIESDSGLGKIEKLLKIANNYKGRKFSF